MSSSDDSTDDTAPLNKRAKGGRTYTANHLTVLLKPVCITMALAAWCVVHIRTDSVAASMSSGLSAYTYYDENDDGHESASGGEVFGKALINSLIIICGVIIMTFGIVLLFKFRCYKTLYAVIAFTTVIALGYNFGFMLTIAIEKWDITVDWLTFVFCIFNFATVGCVAIFYKKGTPTWIGQGYLVIVSVTIAYLLAFLPEWTGWVLLVTLAFYDLCAVLTPCGPLKALVEMAQSRQDSIPGLLYEAQVEEDEDEGAAAMPARVDGRPALSLDSAASSRADMAVPLARDSPVEPLAGGSSGDDGSVSVPVDARRPAAPAQPAEPAANPWDNSVKLGLGDFIFYSLLVAKAALMGFTPFATCFLSIVEGLVMTMLLLAIIQAALPALPFSMLLGVGCFFFSKYVLDPHFLIPFQSSVVFS